MFKHSNCQDLGTGDPVVTQIKFGVSQCVYPGQQ
ncbi:unnamed protein product [Fusarium graminearum]|uniref:Chromosome 3, complete genome n=1 Tax=Gibberella zeae (strain ATCC MYA-4620 / CBS 123657 / FGSC 9075 / NRRL 31084 / PH-1) TaxID=229533 RepID=A0A0E0SN93_GIBZE|nr:hypothetical protein FG05_35129 [Fusarium graminearum]CEF87906.1 unnamed protein product [Fusarium graminearum]